MPRLCGLKRRTEGTLQAVVLRADLYRKIAILNRSRLCYFKCMDMMDKLSCEACWQSFLAYKISGGHLAKSEEKRLTEFIENKEYSAVAEQLQSGGLFSVPSAVQVNKQFSGKKRTVFTFSEAENYVQKLLAYLLLDYDGIFCDNLYSFRRNMGVKKAVTRLVFHSNINEMYSCKLDISDYFNSVNAQKLLPVLMQVLGREERLYHVIEAMLLNPFALIDGEQTTIKKGILAGSPLSGFLANLCLNELDRHFAGQGILYARYSDDIIFFAESEETLASHLLFVLDYLRLQGLSVNPHKTERTSPGEAWTFLGFTYRNGVIDICNASKQKLKKKMRRKARALVRWQKRKNVLPERAAAAFIRHFNKKLFDNPVNNELTWSRWYFPIINTADSLAELDAYMQQCVRFIVTQKQTKAQYRFRYEQMKALGYVTLVNRYYRFKEHQYYGVGTTDKLN